MRTQPRRSLALAAATLVSGVALTAAAPGAAALPLSGGATGTTVRQAAQGQATPGPALGPQEQRGPVTTTLTAFPTTLTAGGPAAEFVATLRNSADHAVNVTTGFTVAAIDSGVRETQLKLDYQAPGGGPWKPAALGPGAAVGATWDLDTSATRLSLPAGSSVSYRLRIAVTADAPAGRATGGFRATVSDPTLPPESRISEANTAPQEFTTVAAAPTGTPTSAPAPGVPYLGLDAVPAAFISGGEARPFRLTLTNRSGRDVAFQPEVTLRGAALPAAGAAALDFQTPDGQWTAATVDGGRTAAGTATLVLRLPDRDASLVRLRDGESRTLNVRLAFGQDVPSGVVSVQFAGTSLPLAGGGAGVPAASSSVDVTVAAPAPVTPTAAPSPSATDGAAPTVPAEPSATAPSTSGGGGPAVALAAVTPTPEASGSTAAVPPTPTPQPSEGAPTAPAPAVTVTVAAPAPSVDLASTGGSSTNTPMAITGATSIAMGIGTLLVAHRRQKARPALAARAPRPAGGPGTGPGTGPGAIPGAIPGMNAAPRPNPAPRPVRGPAAGPGGATGRG
ncbi:hypothetical protein ACFVVU_17780 [Kitasatospora sp. NPDC057965]|uniref:hypothetical protein n=1 Tax=Kitasatospora sp. NPDC057965 TaxID=3346291 RepID=UPI0036D90672